MTTTISIEVDGRLVYEVEAEETGEDLLARTAQIQALLSRGVGVEGTITAKHDRKPVNLDAALKASAEKSVDELVVKPNMKTPKSKGEIQPAPAPGDLKDVIEKLEKNGGKLQL